MRRVWLSDEDSRLRKKAMAGAREGTKPTGGLGRKETGRVSEEGGTSMGKV
jgi:hypothetical protein